MLVLVLLLKEDYPTAVSAGRRGSVKQVVISLTDMSTAPCILHCALRGTWPRWLT